jgi:hypothetical protein
MLAQTQASVSLVPQLPDRHYPPVAQRTLLCPTKERVEGADEEGGEGAIRPMADEQIRHPRDDPIPHEHAVVGGAVPCQRLHRTQAPALTLLVVHPHGA